MRRVERLVQVGVAALLLVAAGGPWAAPVELTIDAHRISVRQIGDASQHQQGTGCTDRHRCGRQPLAAGAACRRASAQELAL